MTVTAIVGAQFGSEGKGAVVAALAHKFDFAVRTGGPNAGHTLWHGGRIYKMRQVPCAWINPACTLVLGAGAVVDLEILAAEEAATNRRVHIDRQAVIIDPHDRRLEDGSGIGQSIGSTLEGVGVARTAKIARQDPTRLAGSRATTDTSDTVEMLDQALLDGRHVLLEGTQGSGLSLHHGHWPYVTSNDTNVAQLLADAGIAPAHLSHTLLVARTYPIRVGGHSGPMYEERQWEDLPFTVQPERTTVTNKVRRIGLWDDALFQRACILNKPCGIVLSFMDYIDPTIRGQREIDRIWTDKVVEFVSRVESEFHVPVVMIGTGGERFAYVNTATCLHDEAWSPLHPALQEAWNEPSN
jgi:adenylosuccinate synthase